jgi:protein-S-isoprenylcysteine O-methyltransferase Ste14
MRIELLPLLFGILVTLLGIGVIADAWLPDREVRVKERRRRQRAERNRRGEGAIGFAIVLLGVAMISRDQWGATPWIVAIAGVLLAAGAILNRNYIREQLDFRGAARRADPGAGDLPPARKATPSGEHFRIR